MRPLNVMAGEVRENPIENVAPRAFTIRKKSFLTNSRTGFRREFAKKDNLTASVFSEYDRFELHDRGGMRIGRGGPLKIPQKSNLGVGNAQIIPKSKRPSALVGRGSALSRLMGAAKKSSKSAGRSFTQTVNGKRGIWQRTGDARLPIRLLYSFNASARIKALFGFYREGERLISKKYNRIFGTELSAAIASAKAKGWEVT